MKIYLLLIALCFNLIAEVDVYLPLKKVSNGGTFAVIFESNKRMTEAPYVIFKKKSYQMFTILGNTRKYELFLPIDYHTKKKIHTFQVVYKKNGKALREDYNIDVIDGNYKKNEIITVPKAKVVLSKENKKRAGSEYSKVFAKVYSKVTQIDYVKKSIFNDPMKSKITSDFGSARIYNGMVKNYHSGTDFKAKIGTSVMASNDGVVALVMDRFYLGKTVYINHGRGAYSYYSHLSSTSVVGGQRVKKNDLIGKSGSTGRVTGPHLHYAIRLYNTTVDPIQFSSLYNEVINRYH